MVETLQLKQWDYECRKACIVFLESPFSNVEVIGFKDGIIVQLLKYQYREHHYYPRLITSNETHPDR